MTRYNNTGTMKTSDAESPRVTTYQQYSNSLNKATQHNTVSVWWPCPESLESGNSIDHLAPTESNNAQQTVAPASHPNIVYFVGESSLPTRCTNELASRFNVTWNIVDSWQDLAKKLESGERLIAFHIDMIEQSGVSPAEFVDAITTIIKFMPDSQPLHLGVVIRKTTHLKVINQLRKTAVTTMLMDINDYLIEEVIVGAQSFVNNHPYWPKHIISQLPGNIKRVPKPESIKLTERQEEVYYLILTRGASNKVIARTLNISESTVKLHVGSILRKHGAKNRTQLAVFATKHK